MHELAILVVTVAAIMAATAVGARFVGPALLMVEKVLLCGSILVILFVMFFVCAEVVMRYAFNSPIPGHLEGSELLMPVIVFLALSFTQATRGHVGMDLVLESLPAGARRRATIGTLVLSVFVCSVLTWFSYKNALQLWRYDDVTMTPPYFHTWPAAAAIPLGYGLVSLRMMIQALHLYAPERFPESAPALHGLHGGGE